MEIVLVNILSRFLYCQLAISYTLKWVVTHPTRTLSKRGVSPPFLLARPFIGNHGGLLRPSSLPHFTLRHVSADVTKWSMYEQNLFAEYHLRYGGYGGVGYYNVLNTYIPYEFVFSVQVATGIREGIQF